MSDREREALGKAVRAAIPDPALSYVHPVVVRAQRSDGTLDVDFEEGGPAPRASGVELAFGLPATYCRFKAGARLQIAYKAGDPRKRIAASYGSYPPKLVPDGPISLPESPVEEINIANAESTQGVARIGDGVNGGTFLWAPTPPVGGIPTGGVLTYTPYPTRLNPAPMPTVWSIVGPVVITQVSPASGTPRLDIGGAIAEGSGTVKVGD